MKSALKLSMAPLLLSTLLASFATQAAETIVGRLLTSQLTVYEQQQRSVLNVVVRANNGSFMLINCELNDKEPLPAIDLREANALMQAYVAGGSRTNVEAEVEKTTSLSGFPTYTMKSFEMPIPGFNDYQFTCGAKK